MQTTLIGEMEWSAYLTRHTLPSLHGWVEWSYFLFDQTEVYMAECINRVVLLSVILTREIQSSLHGGNEVVLRSVCLTKCIHLSLHS